MDRSRHSRGFPRLCTLRQRCRQSPQRSSRVPNRSMWMIMYSSVSSTLVTVCAFSPSCFLINVSTSTSILFLSMAVNNSPQRIRCIEVSSPGQPAVKLLEPNHFSSNYTFGTGTALRFPDQSSDRAYFEVGTTLTANHAHAALFGVFGMLALTVLVFCLRAMQSDATWKETQKFVRVGFWGANVGLALMIILDLFSGGVIQLWDSIANGYWHARRLTFLMGGTYHKLKTTGL